MLKFLAAFTNFWLALLILPAGALVIIDHVASAHYLEQVADQTKAYDELARILPSQLAVQRGDNAPGPEAAAEQAQMLAALQAGLTPDWLRRTASSTVEQLEQTLKHGSGSGVTIDLSELGVKARAAGVAVPDDRFKPVMLPASQWQRPAQLVQVFETLKRWAVTVVIVLAVLAVALGFAVGSYRGLGRSLLNASLGGLLPLIGLIAAPVTLIPNLHFDGGAAAFANVLRAVLKQVTVDVRNEFGLLVLGLGLLGGALMLGGHLLPARRPKQTAPAATPVVATGVDETPGGRSQAD